MPTGQESEEALVARARGGDVAAFGQLVERYQDALFNGIYRMVSRREDAEDIAQETFVRAFRAIKRFQARSSLYTWLYSIAVNLVISHRRKASTAAGRANPLSLQQLHDAEGRPRELDGHTERPDEAAERHERHERVHEAIARLEPDHRAVLVLRDIEGFDCRTVAEVLGCPVGTVKSRLHRARLALKKHLKDLLA